MNYFFTPFLINFYVKCIHLFNLIISFFVYLFNDLFNYILIVYLNNSLFLLIIYFIYIINSFLFYLISFFDCPFLCNWVDQPLFCVRL